MNIKNLWGSLSAEPILKFFKNISSSSMDLKNQLGNTNKKNCSSPFGYIKKGKIYLKGYLNFKDREIGIIKEPEEESIAYFVRRFQIAELKVNLLAKKVNSTKNKGTFLMKLIHMRTYLAKFNALGEFTSLFKKIDVLEKEIRDYISANRIKNLKLKKAILAEAESLKEEETWNMTSNKFRELRTRWIKTGSALQKEEKKIYHQFKQTYTYFSNRKKEQLNKLKQTIESRINQYREILDNLATINAQINKIVYIGEVRSIQKEWKSIGGIPREKFIQLNKKFVKLLQVFFSDLNEASKEVLKAKEDYYNKTNEIFNQGSPYDLYRVRDIQSKWKGLGRFPFPEDKEINKKFGEICNKIFESHFIIKKIKVDYPELENKSEEEQLNIRIDTIKKSVEIDKKELIAIEKEYAHVFQENTRKPRYQNIYLQRNKYLSKIKAKEDILNEWRDELNFVN